MRGRHGERGRRRLNGDALYTSIPASGSASEEGRASQLDQQIDGN